MSTKAYIVPINPNAPSSQSAVPNLDPAKLWSTVPVGKKTPQAGTTRLFYDQESNVTALVSLGDAYESQKGNQKREVVRKAIGSAVKDVKALVEDEIAVAVDASADPQAAGNFAHAISNYIHLFKFFIEAVAAHLALYKFTLKTDPPSAFRPDLSKPIPEQLKFEPLTASKEWDAGVVVAKAQNLARTVGPFTKSCFMNTDSLA
jgi:aminopeptidase